MLPDGVFHPLDLDDALDGAFDKGNDAVIDLLRSAFTDPRARGDEGIAEYLDALIAACRGAGRERDGIDILHQLAKLEPDLADVLIPDIAALHGEIGEDLVGAGLLRQAYAEQQSRPEAERDLAFYGSAAMVAAELAGAADLTRTVASEGLRLALEQEDMATVLLLRTTLAQAAPGAGGSVDPELMAEADRKLRNVAANRRRSRQRPTRLHYRMAYLPEAEYATARIRGLLDVTMHPRHEDYRRELQDTLAKLTAHQPRADASLVPIDVQGLVAYAEREGRDPASRRTRLAYSDSLAGAGRDIPWPPERNARCWCGSDRKYKKCCGAPSFTRVAVPSPASLVLKVTLDGVEPPVWRRIAAPADLPLDQLHRVIQAAMGWSDDHLYEFDNGRVCIGDPRVEGAAYLADQERLISMAAEAGEQFFYLYDFGDGWSHTITLEEIREAGADNVPEILNGAGACPPENCGGPAGYLALTHALSDPSHPDHDHAVERLGADFDPAAYPPPQRRIGA